ncbi:MAG: hypothetical protein GQ553_04420 [Nitrosomonadaceae bacterium]|nr:hypothetical protein [Nitrosomonadaceae bacterium]
MFDSLVVELQREIDRHNLRVTIAQSVVRPLDEGCDDHEVMMEELETTHPYYRYLKERRKGSICMMCLEEVDKSQLDYEFGDIYRQADMLGMESLTEHEQVVTEGRLCSYDCYESMQNAEDEYSKRLRRAANIEANGDTTFYGGPEGGE